MVSREPSRGYITLQSLDTSIAQVLVTSSINARNVMAQHLVSYHLALDET
jgi:hypothetical protein